MFKMQTRYRLLIDSFAFQTQGQRGVRVPSRIPPGYSPGYQNSSRRPNNKPKWLIIGVASLVLLGFVGGTFAFIQSGLIGSNRRKSAERGAGAMALKELERAIRESGIKDVAVPRDLDEAIQILNYRDLQSQMSDAQRFQKFIVCEWLFGESVNDARRGEVSRALSLVGNDLSATTPRDAHSRPTTTSGSIYSDAKLKISVLRAFHRWGRTEDAPVLLKHSHYYDDALPYVLDIFEAYPSVGLVDQVVQLLATANLERALKIMERIGTAGYSKLVPIIDGKDAALSQRVLAFLQEKEVDPDEFRIDYYLAQTNTVFTRDGGWAKIAGIKYNAKYQPEVADALARFDRTQQMELEAWLDACQVWGDSSTIPAMISMLQRKWPFHLTKLVGFLRDHPDARTVEPLVDGLLFDRFANSDAYADLLIHILNSGVDVDLNAIHQRICRGITDWAVFNRSEIKDILAQTKFDYNVLVDQCLADIRLTDATDNAKRAIELLAKMDVIEERRYEVAEAIARLFKSDRFSFSVSPAAFLRWATPENDYVYELIEAGFFAKHSYGKQVTTDALRIAVKGRTEKVLLPLARLLEDDWGDDQQNAMDALVDLGADGEPLCIQLLNSNNRNVLVAACGVLAIAGTEKSIEPLRAIYNKAKRLKEGPVMNAADTAAKMINDRTGVLDREQEEKKSKSTEKKGGNI